MARYCTACPIKNGVAPRTAQAAIRHSWLVPTMKVQPAPTLLDLGRMLARLSELRLRGVERRCRPARRRLWPFNGSEANGFHRLLFAGVDHAEERD